jgi:hypothetical protein
MLISHTTEVSSFHSHVTRRTCAQRNTPAIAQLGNQLEKQVALETRGHKFLWLRKVSWYSHHGVNSPARHYPTAHGTADSEQCNIFVGKL